MIEQILKANEKIDDYRIVTRKTQSYEVFFVHKTVETVRARDTVATDVTVYVNHDDAVGDSTFQIYRSMTEEEMKAKVDAAAHRAALVFNQPYTLPKGNTGSEALKSNFTDYEFSDLAAKIADAVYAADNLEGGSINAVEIFLYRTTVNVRNSQGVDLTETKYHAMIEAIPTWNQGKESVELYESYEFTEFHPEKIREEIARKMAEVRDRQSAVRPETPMTCNVVFHPQEIAEWMGNLTRFLNYSAVYAKSSPKKIGDDLQPERKGDALNVTLHGRLPDSTNAAAFDSDGVKMTQRQLIREGKVESYYGANRFACYLGQEATGNLGCLEVGTGSLTPEERDAKPYLECVSLSGLQVDLLNDYLGGEIRLAYYFDGEKKIPVTGISMSTKFSQALQGLRLSAKSTNENNYQGPEYALIPDVTIV